MKTKEEEKLPESPFPHQLAFVLASPLRKFITNRKRIIEEAGIKKDSIVLEIGCGPGFFTETISLTIGQAGKVYAQDVQKEMLNKAKKRLSYLQTKDNISYILSCASRIDLPDNSIDVVFAFNVFEELEEEGRAKYAVMELWRLLKKDGLLFFSEHRFGGTAPIVNKVFKALIKTGFILIDKNKTFLSHRARFIRRKQNP
jgi:ubiquinone/menaquinone biosynthesis C-methylase UbiE